VLTKRKKTFKVKKLKPNPSNFVSVPQKEKTSEKIPTQHIITNVPRQKLNGSTCAK
jgi:hypothetical protein